MKFASVVLNDFKTILTKDSLRFGIKCGVLSCIFAAIWIYYKIPMGFWGVYSAYIVMQNHTGSTLKKGVQRISGHIIIAIFSYFYAITFLNGYLLLSIIPVIVGYFILGYLVACSDHIRYAGISGGIGFGIMLFEYPLDKLTLQVVYLRSGIIIGSAIVGIIFDHFVFPVKTSAVFNDQLKKNISLLSNVINSVEKKQLPELEENLNNVNLNIYQTSKQITDFSIFQTSRKKFIYLEIFNSLKCIFYNFKKYKLLLEYKNPFLISEQIDLNEKEIILFIKNKFSEIEKLFSISFFKSEFLENKNSQTLNLKEHIVNIRTQNWYIKAPLENRINIYSRIENLYQIANELNYCHEVILKNIKK